MRTEAEVIVVGGGPSGSVLAGLLSGRGRDVLLVDRSSFPRPKPCGECLNPDAVILLEQLGILPRITELLPARIEGWTVRSEGRRAASGTFGAASLYGLSLSRQDLDYTLVRWARTQGVRIREQAHVTGVEPGGSGSPGRVHVRNASGPDGVWPARIVAGADGLRSVVARSAGLVRRRPRLRKLSLTCHLEGRGPDPRRGALFLGSGKMLGLAPLTPEGDRWNATVVVDGPTHGRSVAADPVGFHRAVMDGFSVSWVTPPGLSAGPWASGPFDWPTRGLTRGRVVLVGDAAGYYDPLTGQGIRRAFLSASKAAAAIDATLSKTPGKHDHLVEYERSLGRLVDPGRHVQRAIELVTSRPRLLGAILGRAGRVPDGLTPLFRVTGDVAPVRSLLHPATWMPFFHGASSMEMETP